MRRINMLSSADRVAGQGVGSATQEQIQLMKSGLGEDYDISVNQVSVKGISHYHTIDFKHYIHIHTIGRKNAKVGHVHFLPETIDGSIQLPFGIKQIFYKYIVHFYKQMDYLVTVNPYFIERLVAHGVDRDKIHYIPNYVSKEEFYPMSQEDRKAVRASYGIDQDSFVVLGVGQIQTRKGVLDFIDIAERNPQMTFVWAGGFSFGKITDGYEDLKKVMEAPPKNVKFIGIVDRSQMNAIFNMASVLFMPSYNELFPMSILEAMNCETPILLRELEIYVDILQGYYLKASNNWQFSDLLNQLETNEVFYKKAVNMSKEGSVYYSKDHVLTMWQAFYDHVYQGRMSHKDKVVPLRSKLEKLQKKKVMGQ